MDTARVSSDESDHPPIRIVSVAGVLIGLNSVMFSWAGLIDGSNPRQNEHSYFFIKSF